MNKKIVVLALLNVGLMLSPLSAFPAPLGDKPAHKNSDQDCTLGKLPDAVESTSSTSQAIAKLLAKPDEELMKATVKPIMDKYFDRVKELEKEFTKEGGQYSSQFTAELLKVFDEKVGKDLMLINASGLPESSNLSSSKAADRNEQRKKCNKDETFDFQSQSCKKFEFRIAKNHGRTVTGVESGGRVIEMYTEDGQKIGVLLCSSYGDGDSHIGIVDINQPFQGQGLGKVLVKKGMDECSQILPHTRFLSLDVVKSNIVAIKLYSSMGFQIVGKGPMGFQIVGKGPMGFQIVGKGPYAPLWFRMEYPIPGTSGQ